MQQAVPGLFDALAPQAPTVQAPTAVPGLFSAPEDGHSATIRQAQGNVQSFLADPVKSMTMATLTGTAGQGPRAVQQAGQSWMHEGGDGGAGGLGGNSGLAEAQSSAQSFGGFLGDTFGNMAAIANPSIAGLVGLGYGIANNNPSLGIKGLFDAIKDALGLGGDAPGDGFGGVNGDAGIGGNVNGGQSTSDGSQGDTA